MEARLKIKLVQPESYKAMYHFSAALAADKISKKHKELIKIRASQINGCAFCLDMHSKEALAIGETQQRIFLLNAWKETELFSEEEKTVLAITEEITLINQNGLSDTTYNNAKKFFDDEQIAQIIMAVVNINMWNRIAISTKMEVSG